MKISKVSALVYLQYKETKKRACENLLGTLQMVVAAHLLCVCVCVCVFICMCLYVCIDCLLDCLTAC